MRILIRFECDGVNAESVRAVQFVLGVPHEHGFAGFYLETMEHGAVGARIRFFTAQATRAINCVHGCTPTFDCAFFECS